MSIINKVIRISLLTYADVLTGDSWRPLSSRGFMAVSTIEQRPRKCLIFVFEAPGMWFIIPFE